MDEDIEEEINNIERKEKIPGRLLEYGTSQLSSMRAAMAKTIWRSIKARLAWRETPERAPDDKLQKAVELCRWKELFLTHSTATPLSG